MITLLVVVSDKAFPSLLGSVSFLNSDYSDSSSISDILLFFFLGFLSSSFPLYTTYL